MTTPRRHIPRSLVALFVLYLCASLVHFIHNAEFLPDYPGLPHTWTRAGVYGVWLGISAVGAFGYLILSRGHAQLGLLLLVIYSVLGLESLGHYTLAPMASHTMAMNASILVEVGAAAALLMAVLRLLSRVIRDGGAAAYDA